jgi:hypothetical protein
VAVLFQPLRRRGRDRIDRRFNRRRYDAVATIRGFGDRLRGQLDLDSLSTELRAAVDQSLQPTRVSLWLPPVTRTSAPHGRRERRRATS